MSRDQNLAVAQATTLKPIEDIAARLSLSPQHLEPYGRFKAKIALEALTSAPSRSPGKLILVSAINPTPAGEGKTTTTVGLGQALAHLNKKVAVAVREPSMGPVFGVKGGGCGGGRSQVLPMEDINLHFTGDIHAVTSAHNLLSAMMDNALFHGSVDLDVRQIRWRRAMDMNDRALRQIVIGLGGRLMGVPREEGFDITAASEVMAILCLTNGPADLIERLSRIVIGFSSKGKAVTASEVQASEAMAIILKDALKPNLVQTVEGVPAFVHGGPFGNIAHGCNSILATRLALSSADFVVTEAGFGFDLGGEKFLDIKCREAGLWPSAVVLVATVKALKMHGGAALNEINKPDLTALKVGMSNLVKHAESVREYGLQPIVAVNRFATDTEDELKLVTEESRTLGLEARVIDVFGQGGEGGLPLAEAVVTACQASTPTPRFLYPLEASIEDKIRTIAQKIYGAADIALLPRARTDLERINSLGYSKVPICMAKTQLSLSDDPKLFGRPRDFTLTVREIRLSAGAGFCVPLTGDMLTMPGLAAKPAAIGMKMDASGKISGMF
ncbi:MAG: formate--tetrahydrofolate ligase [Deltaproteobacteria bacterium]|nr:formate--tetrahydrofolate ligase [Deltaproteobacteria bacterium]